MANLTRGIWPPMIFPGPLSEATSHNGGTAVPAPAPPLELPAAPVVSQNWTAPNEHPTFSTTYVDPNTTRVATNTLLQIVQPSYPPVANQP